MWASGQTPQMREVMRGISSTGRVAAADHHAVGAPGQGGRHHLGVDASRAHHPHDVHVRRVLEPRRARGVGAGVRAPVAEEGHDARLPGLPGRRRPGGRRLHGRLRHGLHLPQAGTGSGPSSVSTSEPTWRSVNPLCWMALLAPGRARALGSSPRSGPAPGRSRRRGRRWRARLLACGPPRPPPARPPRRRRCCHRSGRRRHQCGTRAMGQRTEPPRAPCRLAGRPGAPLRPCRGRTTPSSFGVP